jgi:hypothetical protein
MHGARIYIGLAVLVVNLTVAASASERRQLDAYVHGAARITFVVENEQLVVELETPLFNLISFEHTPRTDMQHKSYEKTFAILREPRLMFDVRGAECSAPKNFH